MSALQFVAPILLLELFWLIHLASDGLYWRLIMPEHMQPGIQYLEWIQFSAYCGAGIVALLSLRQLDDSNTTPPRIWLYAFLLGTTFLALEEISYGQRVFNFNVPEAIKKVNLQGEFNIHNTKLVQRFVRKSYILVGFVGAFGWLSRPFLKKYPIINLVTPDGSLSTYFLPAMIFYLWVEVFLVPASWLHQELFELILAIGVFQFSLMNYKKIISRSVL